MTGSPLWLCTWSCFQWSSKSHTQTTQLRSRPSLLCHSCASPACIAGGLWVTEHMLACQSEAMKLSPFTRRRSPSLSGGIRHGHACTCSKAFTLDRHTFSFLILSPRVLGPQGLVIYYCERLFFFDKSPGILELQPFLERAHLKPREARYRSTTVLLTIYIWPFYTFIQSMSLFW